MKGLGHKRTGGDHPNYYFIEIYQNTEKRPGDLWRLAITQASVKDHQQTLNWKTLRVNNNNNKMYHAVNEKWKEEITMMLGTILKMNKSGTQTNGPENKQVDDDARPYIGEMT